MNLHRHNHLYYVLNTPEISDLQFDQLMERLIILEKQNPGLTMPIARRNVLEAISMWNLTK